jgi:PAS domain-containing protein
MMTLTDFASISLIAFFGAWAIVVTLGFSRRHKIEQTPEPHKEVIMLFRDDALLDATPDAFDLLGHDIQGISDLSDTLHNSFPELRTVLADTPDWTGRMVSPISKALKLDISSLQGTLKYQLLGDFESLAPPDSQKARRTKALMQDVRQSSPQLVWQQNHDGKVIWFNAAYRDQVGQHNDAPFLDLNTDMDGKLQKQQRVTRVGDDKQWFDVTTVARDDHYLHFAIDATALVRADQDRRNFVQTLGKTFADLSIGLAIFDKDRQLAMFNPALLDMTKLPVTFLSARPTIDTVLDRLRELRMMPEPKDYASWREEFTAVEAGAKNGTYTENWALPDGQTYRVTGRPHPDGAFAILFEDITAEVSLTRRFRSDIETGQAVLDTLPDAIAVFSGTGTMVVSNRSYSKLWSTQAELLLDHRDVKTEVSVWQDSCIASPMWTEMRNFIQRMGGRKPWSENAMLVDGRHLRCHAMPIAGGMTMVRFVIAPPMRPVIQKLTQVDHALLAGKV